MFMPRLLRTLAAFCLSTASLLALADNPAVGSPLPTLSLENRGEILLGSDGAYFQPWHSQQLSSGKVHVVQYMAGTMGASKLNQPLTDAIDAAKLGTDHLLITTVINLTEVPRIGWGFALSEIRSNKQKYPMASLVVDAEGLGLNTWSLRPSSSAIAVVDSQQQVLFFKDGALTAEEVDQVLGLLKQQIQGLQKTAVAQHHAH